MARVKVPLFRSPRYVSVDPEATRGATVGVNLTNPDGTLWQPSVGGGAQAAPSPNVSLQDVLALAASPVKVAGSVAGGAFTYSWNGTTSDVPEGSRQYFTPARAYAALKAQLVAGANVQLVADDSAQTVRVVAASGDGSGGVALPAGGLAGMALVKESSADGDAGWGYPTPIDGGTFN